LTLLTARKSTPLSVVLPLVFVGVGTLASCRSATTTNPPSVSQTGARVSDLPAPPPLPDPQDALLETGMLRAQLDSTQRLGLQEALRVAMRAGDLWRAESILRTMLRQQPNSRLLRFLLADGLRQQARFDDSRRLYEQLLREDKREIMPYLGLAQLVYSQNRRTEAWDWLARGVQASGQNVNNLHAFAARYQEWKDFVNADKLLQKALQIAPDNRRLQIQRATLLFLNNRWEESRTILEEIVRRSPKNRDASLLLATLLTTPAYSKQDFTRAHILQQRALELNWQANEMNRQDSKLYRLASLISRQRGEPLETAKASIEILKLDPYDAEARCSLGQAYALLDKTDLSRKQRTLCELLRQRQRQLATLRNAIAAHPTKPGPHSALARFLELSGDFPGAVRESQTAVGLAPGDASHRAALEKLYARLGWPKPAPNR
jgi:tetratricopeptide (TPR) repeat protein